MTHSKLAPEICELIDSEHISMIHGYELATFTYEEQLITNVYQNALRDRDMLCGLCNKAINSKICFYVPGNAYHIECWRGQNEA